VELTCYNMHHRGKDYIGTSFPAESQGMTQTQAATRIQAQHRGRDARKDPRAHQEKKNQVCNTADPKSHTRTHT